MNNRNYGLSLLDIDLRPCFRCCFLLMVLFLSSYVEAKQYVVSDDSLSVSATDSIQVDSSQAKNNLIRAAGGVALVQVIPWAFSYYITKADFAKISFKSVGGHLKLSSWAWDDDQFTTNQFSHPYHGNLYFNSFRANDYGILTSSLATIGSSLIWEIAGEAQPPSPNDLINTSFGGIVLGEMTHRLANKLLNNHSVGMRRHTNEFFGLLINPMNGFNRILTGKWGKTSLGNNEMDTSVIDAQFDLGLRRINTDHNLITKGKNALYGRMRFLYQDESQSVKKPFDEFSVDIEIGIDDSALVNTLSVYGLIYGKELLANDRVKHLGVLSANYDLFHNSSFFYGGQSVNMNLMSEFKLGSKSKISTALGIGPVLLAAIPDQYLQFGKHRNYDYGSGLSLEGNMKVNIIDKFKLGLQYTGGIVGTISGNHSNYSLHALSAELGIYIIKDFSLNMSSGFFTVKGNYRDYADVVKRYSFGRVSLGYHMIF